jgi:hypothetical protein
LKKAIFAIIRTFGQEYSICFNQLISKNKMHFNSA